jgi:hypothetical protein
MMMRIPTLTILALSALILSACGSRIVPAEDPDPQQMAEAQKASDAAAGEGERASAGGVSWAKPSGWIIQQPRPMRAATYTVPSQASESAAGECAVFYFGPNQGGGVDANIARWLGQVQQPDGSDTQEEAEIGKGEAGGMTVTTVDVSGTYLASSGPMMQVKETKPDHRLVGAIVEGPQGAVFFKFTGPAETVAGAKEAFDAMVQSVRTE